MYTQPLTGIIYPPMAPENFLTEEQNRLENQYPSQRKQIQAQTEVLQRLVIQCRDKGIVDYKITQLLRDNTAGRELDLRHRRADLTSAKMSRQMDRLGLQSQLRNFDAPSVILRFPNEQKLKQCLEAHPCTRSSYFEEKRITESVAKELAGQQKLWPEVEESILLNEKVESLVVALSFTEAVLDCAETIEETKK